MLEYGLPATRMLLVLMVLVGCTQAEVQCVADDQCGPTLVCTDGLCVAPCRNDTVCGDQAICIAARCAAGCRSDEGCPLGQICQDLVCVNGCATRARCPARGSGGRFTTIWTSSAAAFRTPLAEHVLPTQSRRRFRTRLHIPMATRFRTRPEGPLPRQVSKGPDREVLQ